MTMNKQFWILLITDAFLESDDSDKSVGDDSDDDELENDSDSDITDTD